MGVSPFDELGLAPTGDEVAIRLAYAARLKTIDVDADPAAFIRLREAYEDALAAARFRGEGEEGEEDAEEEKTDGGDRQAAESAEHEEAGATTGYEEVAVAAEEHRAQPTSALPRDPYALPYDAFDRFRAEFRSLIETGGYHAAAGALTGALAQGVVPIAEAGRLAYTLAAAALTDDSLTPEEIETIAGACGEGTDWPEWRLRAVLDDLAARKRALRWWTAIAADARRGRHWPVTTAVRLFIQRTRIARATHNAHFRGLWEDDLPAWQAETAKARVHARWLGQQLDLERLETALERFERRCRRARQRTRAAIGLFGAAGAAVVLKISPLIAATFLALAIIVLGNWFFMPFGILLLGVVGWVLFWVLAQP